MEFYGNISQNYRSVTFADISITNPAYAINPNIDDEKGYTADIGLRGNIQNKISFDSSIFALSYSCLLYTSPSPRDATLSRMPSSA